MRAASRSGLSGTGSPWLPLAAGEALALQSKLTVGPAPRAEPSCGPAPSASGPSLGAQGCLPRVDGEGDMNVAALPAKNQCPERSSRAGTNRRVYRRWRRAVLSRPREPAFRPVPRRGFALRSYWRAASHPVPDRWDRGVPRRTPLPWQVVQGTGSCKVTRLRNPVNTSADVSCTSVSRSSPCMANPRPLPASPRPLKRFSKMSEKPSAPKGVFWPLSLLAPACLRACSYASACSQLAPN